MCHENLHETDATMEYPNLLTGAVLTFILVVLSELYVTEFAKL